MEIPEEMQEQYGFAALGDANSAVKNKIFGYNSARLYKSGSTGRLSSFHRGQISLRSKDDYRAKGELESLRTNTSYGYIARETA